ncbi:hypothetical protein [Flavobacterium sp. UBA7680]|uniref:hypothetical protein n=1 Tax=Flavobacterium sp. UBA7680 TaxID=1946559 RepID=UPI0025C11BE5|nr:hypothetical protein [Flavobacterium sp. UBA7680]
MIKIEHPDLISISNKYSKNIKSLFLSKINDILEVISILESSGIADEKTVLKKVNNFTSAIKIVIGKNKLLNSKHPVGEGKNTNDLIFTLNYYKIKSDKRSKCRKTKTYNELKNKINNLATFIQDNDLFGSLPYELIDLNDELKLLLTGITKRAYNYFFNYNNYYTPINNDLGKALDLKCCPYCNRNFITYIPDKNSRIIGPTYDHFFNKARYEYLTLSFYNLIPSCYICNCNLKLDADFKLNTHLHPYLGGFGNDVFFDFELSTKSNINNKKISFSLNLKPHHEISLQKKERIFGIPTQKKSGNLNVFKLQEVYQSHGDSVEEIYRKFDKTSYYYIGSISDIINKLNTSEEEFYRFYFRNYYKPIDFNKRPLAKLDRDIYNKLKMISEQTLHADIKV